MIITTEDTFSRKPKSSVISIPFISLSQNEEFLKTNLSKQPELHITESDITSNRGSSRMGLLKSYTKRTRNQQNRSSSTTYSSFSQVETNNESLLFMEDFREKSSWNLKKGKHMNSQTIASVNNSQFGPVGGTLKKNDAYECVESKPSNFQINSGRHIVTNNVKTVDRVAQRIDLKPSGKLERHTSQGELLSTVDEKFYTKNFMGMHAIKVNDLIQQKLNKFGSDFEGMYKNGREQIIVYNVQCVQNSKQQAVKQSNENHPKENEIPLHHPSCHINSPIEKCYDSTPNECENEEVERLKINNNNMQTEFLWCEPGTSQDSSVKERNSKSQFAGPCPRHDTVTKPPDYNPIALNSQSNSYYIACSKECVNATLPNSQEPPNNSNNDFPILPNINLNERLLNTPNTKCSPRAIPDKKPDFSVFPFWNYVNIDQNDLHQSHNIQTQGITNVSPKQSSFDPQHSPRQPRKCPFHDCRCNRHEKLKNIYKEREVIIKNTSDNSAICTNNRFNSNFSQNDIETYISALNEEVFNKIEPMEKRKIHCSLYRKGTEDKEEILVNPTYEFANQEVANNFNKAELARDRKILRHTCKYRTSPNMDFKLLSFEDEAKLKHYQNSNRQSQTCGFGNEHTIQTKQPRATNNDFMVIDSFQEFPMDSSTNSNKYTIKSQNTNILPQSIPILGDCRCRGDPKIGTEEREYEEHETSKENAYEKFMKPNDNIIETKALQNDITIESAAVKKEAVNNIRPFSKKKRSCSLCRSGTADEGELSVTPNEDSGKKREIKFVNTKFEAHEVDSLQHINKEGDLENTAHAIQNERSLKTTDNPVMKDPFSHFPIFPSSTLDVRTVNTEDINVSPPQTIHNAKTDFCGCCSPFLNYEDELSVDATYQDAIKKVDFNFNKSEFAGDRKILRHTCKYRTSPKTDFKYHSFGNGTKLIHNQNRKKQSQACNFENKPNIQTEQLHITNDLMIIDSLPNSSTNSNKSTIKILPQSIGNCGCRIDPKTETQLDEKKISIENTNKKPLNNTDNLFDTKVLQNNNTAESAVMKKEVLDGIKPVGKKRRDCSICRSGTADEGELSLAPNEDNGKKDNGKKRDIKYIKTESGTRGADSLRHINKGGLEHTQTIENEHPLETINNQDSPLDNPIFPNSTLAGRTVKTKNSNVSPPQPDNGTDFFGPFLNYRKELSVNPTYQDAIRNLDIDFNKTEFAGDKKILQHDCKYRTSPNMDFQYHSIENETKLKHYQNSKAQSPTCYFENKATIETEESHITNDLMGIGSLKELPMVPSPNSNKCSINTQNTEVLPQSMQNTKSDSFKNYSFLNNNIDRMRHMLEDGQNPKILCNIKQECCSKLESRRPSHVPQYFILGDCRCRRDAKTETHFKDQETSIEHTYETLLKTTDNIPDGEVLQNSLAAESSAVKTKMVNNTKPVDNKKGTCSLCRSGTVDEGELSLTQNEVNGRKRDIQFIDTKFGTREVDDRLRHINKEGDSKNRARTIQTESSPKTTTNLMLGDSPSGFPLFPRSTSDGRTVKTRSTSMSPLQLVENHKPDFCRCCPSSNYIDVHPKEWLQDTQNQEISHISHEHQGFPPKLVTNYSSDPQYFVVGDCRSTSDTKREIRLEENNTLIEKSKKNVVRSTEDKKFRENNFSADKTAVNEEIVGKKSVVRKKRSCTLCRSGTADEGQLSVHPRYEGTSKKGYINFGHTKGASRETEGLKHIRTSISSSKMEYKKEVGTDINCIESLVEQNKNEDIRNENAIQTDRLMQATKSVEFEIKQTEALPRTIDIGRNITIQIIPNCATSHVCNEPRNVSPKKFIGDYPCGSTKNISISRNQFDDQPHKIEETMYRAIRECNSENRDRQINKWWSCSWRRKKYPYPQYRNPNCRITQDCCRIADTSFPEPADCQRVMPIPDNYRIIAMQNSSKTRNCSKHRKAANKNENILRYIQHLNKAVLQELLSTPCPSSSSACIPISAQEIKKAPLSLCEGPSHLYSNVKPLTMNQCSQYEPTIFNCTGEYDGMKPSISATNENKTLYECLKYLTNKISYIESRFESDDEYENYSHRNVNACCCCCYCCNSLPKCDCYYSDIKPSCHKKVKPCTQSRSVEVMHSLKNCGTSVSNVCLKENVCTNTEIRPKISKAIIRRKFTNCCRPACCHCCRPAPCCPFLLESRREFRENRPPLSRGQYENEMACCQREHVMYSCQCEHQIPLCQTEVGNKSINYITTETKNTSTSEYQSVKSCQCSEAKSEVKATNTTTTLEHASNTNDELMKSITLDLCSLGEKKLSKFGVPSRQYHWSKNTFLPNMPNEIYRFIRAESFPIPIVEEIHDPTPCLRPEVVNINSAKNAMQTMELIELNEYNLSDASGDLMIEDNINEKGKLTEICGALFGSDENEQGKFHNSEELCVASNGQFKFSSEPSLSSPQYTRSNNLVGKKQWPETENHRNSKANSKQQCRIVYLGEEIKKEKGKGDEKNRTEKFEERTTLQQKLNLNGNKLKVRLTNKVLDNIQLRKDEKLKALGNSVIAINSNYVPKPFTTRTGLMSFVPPFRESFRSCTQVNNFKKKLSVENVRKTNVKKLTSIQKTDNIKDMSDVGDNKAVKQENPNSMGKTVDIEMQSNKEQNINATTSKNEEPVAIIMEATPNCNTELDSQEKLAEPPAIKNETDPVERKETDSKFLRNPIEVDVKKTSATEDFKTLEQKVESKKPNIIVPKKFDEIYSFCDKCFKPSSNESKTVMSVPYFRTNVADIVKSVEFRSSSTSNSFFHSLVGSSVVNTKNQNDSNNSYTDLLYDENGKRNNLLEFGARGYNTQLYEKCFRQYSYHNSVQIPQKILSKTDLISLK